MKIKSSLFLSIITLAASAAAFAAKPLAGPKGGRILTTEAPHAEFFVNQERYVVMSFYDKNLKPLDLSGQVVVATAEAPTGKAKLEFAPAKGSLVSKTPLPPGDDYTVVVQIRENAGARPQNHRILFHDELCAECKRAEYACICSDEKAKNHNH